MKEVEWHVFFSFFSLFFSFLLNSKLNTLGKVSHGGVAGGCDFLNPKVERIHNVLHTLV